LIERLEMSSEVIEDLVEVFKIIDNNYDVRINKLLILLER